MPVPSQTGHNSQVSASGALTSSSLVLLTPAGSVCPMVTDDGIVCSELKGAASSSCFSRI
eukprot:CAMPEP_0185907356 /NCGR_PEP_ID=MMETSP0196C-20130402/6973_1 /TAXON_ID=2932 /ORGANISM="Alexandrium fundyense, Strain CCMP1719" /LENGTH=59 /DNA_ID=CAMNT_0028627315 /DNA_START=132 /DNA_END=308 /DNA_ORIENTATION=-